MSRPVRDQLAELFVQQCDPENPNILGFAGIALERFPNVSEADFLGAISDAAAAVERQGREARHD